MFTQATFIASLVALHVRAWIETKMLRQLVEQDPVALHVRAWIETSVALGIPMFLVVALHVRAWIETK